MCWRCRARTLSCSSIQFRRTSTSNSSRTSRASTVRTNTSFLISLSQSVDLISLQSTTKWRRISVCENMRTSSWHARSRPTSTGSGRLEQIGKMLKSLRRHWLRCSLVCGGAMKTHRSRASLTRTEPIVTTLMRALGPPKKR